MKLNQTLKYLNENGYICEFLNQYFEPRKIFQRINDELDLIITDEHLYKFNPGGSFTFVDETNNKAELKKLKEKIMNIIVAFNYIGNIKDLNDGTINVSFTNASALEPETKYEPNTNFRIFLHGSTADPDTIARTGIRVKRASENYDPRVYLEALDLKKYKSYKEIAHDLCKEDILTGGYNIFHYIVKLPKGYKIYKDPEGYGSDCIWSYTKQSIPPEFILYLGQGGTLYDDETGDEEEVDTELVATEKEILDFISK